MYQTFAQKLDEHHEQKHGPTKRMEQLRDWMNDCKTKIERGFWVDADVAEDGSSSFLLPGKRKVHLLSYFRDV